MRRFSLDYVKSKVCHAYLRATVRPPDGLDTIPGYLHPLEGRFLLWLARRVPDNGWAVEIGSFKGKSSSFLAAGLRGGARLACIDTWLNDAMPDARADVLSDFIANTSPYAKRIVMNRAESVVAASKWTAPIDVLFIDGDHSYEACRADIEAWLPFLKQGGWIAFHDADKEGVARAIRYTAPRLRYRTRLQTWSILAIRKR